MPWAPGHRVPFGTACSAAPEGAFSADPETRSPSAPAPSLWNSVARLPPEGLDACILHTEEVGGTLFVLLFTPAGRWDSAGSSDLVLSQTVVVTMW